MSFISKFRLEYLLKNKKTFDEITELCSKHSTLCASHKELLCKKSLQVSGYSVPRDTDACSVLKELLSLAKSIERPSKSNIILVDRALANAVDMYGSPALKDFFIKNGHKVKTNKRTKTIIKKTYNIHSTDTRLMN